MRIATTGAGGQLGQALVRRGAIPLAADVCDTVAITDEIAAARPAVVVNCAAFVDVDGAEGHGLERAFAVNACGAAIVATATRAAGARTIQLSTNYVFAGDSATPYTEGDRPTPASVYGISKLAGELAALARDPNALVVRTAALYGHHGSRAKGGSFVDRVLGAARAGVPLSVVDDQYITPTSCDDLADALLRAAATGATGTLHLTNTGACTWHGFAVAILALSGCATPVNAALTEHRPGRAPRPANGVLAMGRAPGFGLPALRPWQEALATFLSAAVAPDRE